MNTEQISILQNKFHVKGRIVSERPGKTENIVILTLIVKDYTDIFPEIRCKKAMLDGIKNHTILDVSGYIMSIRGIPRLYATEVSQAMPLLEKTFGIKGRFWEPKSCYYYIIGIIEKIKEDDQGNHPYIRYFIRTEVPDAYNQTSIRIDWRKIDRHPEFSPGDKICAICKIHTPSKKIGTETRHFMNLDVFDMNKIDDTAESTKPGC